MTTRTVSSTGATTHPASSNQVEERLRARHIPFTFEPNLPADEIVVTEGQQVRLIGHRAPPEMVARYAQQMKAGAVFPAIVVNDRRELIDGNTRRLASVKAGNPVIAAYICAGLSALEARALSVELNQANGLAMTEEEIHAFVIGAVQEGQTLDTKSYARMTGVRVSKLSRWMAQANFQMRARRCGISQSVVDALSHSAQAALNAVRLTPVFIELTSLAASARVSTTDLRGLVGSVNAAASEEDALGRIDAEREIRGGDIRALASGFAVPKSKARASAAHIAALLNLDVEDLLDVRPDRQRETALRLHALRDHINHAVDRADARWGTLTESSDERRGQAEDKPLCHQGAGGG
jgi:hypothetical protein